MNLNEKKSDVFQLLNDHRTPAMVGSIGDDNTVTNGEIVDVIER